MNVVLLFQHTCARPTVADKGIQPQPTYTARGC